MVEYKTFEPVVKWKEQGGLVGWESCFGEDSGLPLTLHFTHRIRWDTKHCRIFYPQDWNAKFSNTFSHFTLYPLLLTLLTFYLVTLPQNSLE